MNSTISYTRFLASAMCVLVLAGCDSIKDVPEEPYANLPTPLTVVGGTVTGLSSLRSITVTNNGDRATGQTFAAPNPTGPGEQVALFNFGGIKQGQPYHIEVALQPFGKHCEVTNEGSPAQGTVGTSAVNVVIKCVNDLAQLPGGARYDVTVSLPSDRSLFIDLPGSVVRLTTEEQIYDLNLKDILDNPTLPENVDNYALLTTNPNDRKVKFIGVLANATGQPNAFPWLVGAYTREGGRLNKCSILAGTASNTSGTTTTNPTGHVTNPRVGTAANQTVSPCKFTIGGRVGYSQPISTPYTVQTISGLKLELRNAQGRPVGNLGAEFTEADDPVDDPVKGPRLYSVADCSPSTPAVTVLATAGATSAVTATNFGCSFTLPWDLRSNSDSVFDLVVAEHPAGMRCLVTKGGAALLFVANPTTAASANTNPGNVTDTNVICRRIPTDQAKLLTGVYRLKSQTWNTQATTTSTPVTVSWRPFNRAVQNHATSAMLAFFDDGTFLYGTHNNDAGTQVEHGFYDYDPNANTGFTFRVGGRTVTLTADYSADTTAANVSAAIAAQLASTLPGVTVGFSGTRVTFTANTPGPEFNDLVVVNGNGTKITVDPDSNLTFPGSAGVAAVTTTGPMNLAFNTGGRLSFSPIVDTNPSQTFPAGFSNANNWGVDGSFGLLPSVSGTPGISASPGSPRLRYSPATVSTSTTTGQTTYITEPTMREVEVGSAGLRLDEVDDEGNVVIPDGVPPVNAIVRTLTGRWGAAGTAAVTNGGSTTLIPATTGNSRLDWILEEPPQVANEMTGTWISQDHRRFWVWDFRTYYGFAVGVLGGGTNLNDACFTMEDVRAHSGLYTRRGTITGCYPFNRPSNVAGASGTTYAVGTKESRQMVVPPPGTGALADYTSTNAGQLPGFIGFIPGGVSAFDGRSPSPTYFHIAPAATFFDTAKARLFPENFPVAASPATDLSWCDTEVLGIRATSHDIPINYPVYLCRAE